MKWVGCLLSVGVAEDKIDECMEWALGEGYGTMLMSDTPKIWNERHGELFILKSTDDVTTGVKEIGKAYLKQKD